MASKTLVRKKVPATVNPNWPLTEKDYLLNLTEEEVRRLGPDAQQALKDYKAGKSRPIEELFEELRAKRNKAKK
ncbi:MAG TPA: hypothetical protein VHZ04_03085 [Candidatus Paceibacterota bacterium]|nr:hypothetical protein [Candidatus Paceibacterota bacterium]